jgi:hypothetical protein
MSGLKIFIIKLMLHVCCMPLLLIFVLVEKYTNNHKSLMDFNVYCSENHTAVMVFVPFFNTLQRSCLGFLIYFSLFYRAYSYSYSTYTGLSWELSSHFVLSLLILLVRSGFVKINFLLVCVSFVLQKAFHQSFFQL